MILRRKYVPGYRICLRIVATEPKIGYADAGILKKR